MTLPQTTLDRIVTEDRARHVAEILFPDDVPLHHTMPDVGSDDPFWVELRARLDVEFDNRVAQVRAAIQATFPTPNPQSRKS